MGIFDPTTLRGAIVPMTFANWIVGISVFEYPIGHPRPFLSFIYSFACVASYEVTVYATLASLLSPMGGQITTLGDTCNKAFIFGSMVLVITVTILGWVRGKGIQRSVSRIAAVDDSMSNMGIPKKYRAIFVQQLWQLAMITVVIFGLNMIDIHSIFERYPGNKFRYSVIFLYPIIVLYIADCTFFNIVWYIGTRFESLNDFLDGLVTSNSNRKGTDLLFPKRTIRVAENSRVKLSFVHESRDIHLELCRIAREFNETYGIQLLMSMAVSFGFITGILYSCYTAMMMTTPESNLQTVMDVIAMTSWCAVYVVKVLMINHSCAVASDEAKRTGGIIHDLHDSTANEELRNEIQEFSLQILQNTINFTACGFFTLNYTFVQGVIGSVTTYLVILIQMSPVPASSSDPAVNKTTI